MPHHLLQHRAYVPSPFSSWQPYSTIPSIVGSLTALTTFVLVVVFTSQFIRTIHVEVDPIYWSSMARLYVYDLCYNGCADCLDVSIITQACRKTARATVANVNCDAGKRWWWGDDAAKYPVECLLVIGEGLRIEEEANKRFWWNALYLLALLSIPLGYGIFVATQWVMKRLEHSQQGVEGDIEPPLPEAQAGKAYRGPRNINSRTPLLAAAIIALALPTKVQAYTCITDPVYNQLFSNPSRTIHGVVHGWLSDCYDESYSCGESCSTSPTSGERSCDTNWCDRPKANRTPRNYVNHVVPYIQKCGFNLVDYLPVVVDKRIANSNIEEKYKVKVSVSSFNGTEGLDEGVKCLYYTMVQPPKWEFS